jgi:phage/plasmid-associated DNA primase
MGSYLPIGPGWFTHADGQPLHPAEIRRSLPVDDLSSATAIAWMCSASGVPIRYGTQTKIWRQWDGSVWAACHELAVKAAELLARVYAEVLDMIRAGFEALAASARDAPEHAGKSAEAREKIYADVMLAWEGPKSAWKLQRGYAAKIRAHAGQRAIAGALADHCHADDDDFDAATTGYIACEGQVIDASATIELGRVITHAPGPGFLATRRLAPGLAYDPDAACPHFERFLATSVPDPWQRWWLCWRTAQALAGLMPRKGWLNLIGEPDSGKSTLIALLLRLAGGYAGPVAVETFLAGKTDGGFARHELRGMRLILTSEPPSGKRLDESLIKAITGRDAQRTAAKNQGYVVWTPQGTIMAASNDPIPYNTADAGSLARLEPVRFSAGYGVADPHLLENLSAELPGILRLLMDHLAAERGMRDAGWTPDELPASMVAHREDLADQTENPLAFITEMINDEVLAQASGTDPSAWARSSHLYLLYRAWCEAQGIDYPGTQKLFSAKVGRRNPVVHTRDGNRFTGLVMAKETWVPR